MAPTYADGQDIAATSPRGGVLQLFADTKLQSVQTFEDVCGVAASSTGFLATIGSGKVVTPSGVVRKSDIAWDNHLVRINQTF